mmetsp:Transcript_16966/g.25583  ORF Transcript_16966/g.25583 Transcript_16966/m.25583 type:complete len:233 (+) Transcript_16966:207-905(+)|eukprot:CAMPEP_0185022280 /NCGR_PEP_ID=MMETSP1103-20130426/4993_1 /TAXON_ID=36769 /ORGANISM="Paraphysomonas bandaiensis, Strain Caron Lab Isolate" /LENGTH=232 /DNA_ID=CAMNT_0027554275 /DNA_START=414 /DNA_END=1112 /DNA_ORIENTATION=-
MSNHNLAIPKCDLEAAHTLIQLAQSSNIQELEGTVISPPNNYGTLENVYNTHQSLPLQGQNDIFIQNNYADVTIGTDFPIDEDIRSDVDELCAMSLDELDAIEQLIWDDSRDYDNTIGRKRCLSEVEDNDCNISSSSDADYSNISVDDNCFRMSEREVSTDADIEYDSDELTHQKIELIWENERSDNDCSSFELQDNDSNHQSAHVSNYGRDESLDSEYIYPENWHTGDGNY